MKLTCRASYFILSCFIPVFLLTSYEAITAHLWVLISRLFLLALRLTHPLLFRPVGFLHRCVIFLIIARKHDVLPPKLINL